jgi:hypothetical protein
MKNVLKNILTSAIFIVFFIGCATVKHNTVDVPLGASMKIEYVMDNAKTYQIDSIVVADTLPNIDKWLVMTYMDYETNKRILKRMYIRKYNNGSETSYIIIGSNEPYKVTKRIIR